MTRARPARDRCESLPTPSAGGLARRHRTARARSRVEESPAEGRTLPRRSAAEQPAHARPSARAPPPPRRRPPAAASRPARPRERSVSRSPNACAFFSTRKPNGRPGISTSSGAVVDEHEEAPARPARPCAAARSSAGSAARSRTSSSPASRRGSPRAARRPRRRPPSLGRHEAEDRDVAAGARVAQQRAQRVVVGVGGLVERAAGLDLGEQLAGHVLGDLHVGLVERVDLQRPAGDRRRELGEEEDPAEVAGPAGRQRHRRLAGLGERPHRRRRSPRRDRRCRAGRRRRGPRRRPPARRAARR